MKRFIAYLCVMLFLCIAYPVLGQNGTNSISVTVELQVQNEEIEELRKPGRVRIDMIGDSTSGIIQTFATGTVTQITIAADVATNGVAYFRNTTTNTDRFIDVGVQDTNTNFIAFMRIPATERYLVRLHPTNLFYAEPTGGSVNMRTLVVED